MKKNFKCSPRTPKTCAILITPQAKFEDFFIVYIVVMVVTCVSESLKSLIFFSVEVKVND